MKPAAPAELLARAAAWKDLTRWERAELGRALRSLGWTYGEIRELIPVPKGTLSNWCREIRLSAEQIVAIKERTYGARRGVPVDTQWRRRAEIGEIRRSAAKEAATLIANPLWLAGLALYWGEGGKTDRRLSVTNSDHRLLNLFIAWSRQFIDHDAEFVLALNLHAANDEATAKSFWREALNLESPRFTKTFVKPEGTGHRKNHLSYGVCRVRMMRSTDEWLRVMEWIDQVAEWLGGTWSPTATLTSGR